MHLVYTHVYYHFDVKICPPKVLGQPMTNPAVARTKNKGKLENPGPF